MTVDDARQKLIDLELLQREESTDLELGRERFQELLEYIDTKDQATNARRKAIADARAALKREEAIEQAESVGRDAEYYLERFTGLAEDKAWSVGTGNEDAILPHQWAGALFGGVAKRWILGDWPGLGKTRTSIAWADLVQAKRILIVCQAEICDQFAGEVMTYAPDRELTNLYHVKGFQRKGVKTSAVEHRHLKIDEAVSKDGVIVVNFEMFRTDKIALLKLVQWQADTIIVDEAHNMKAKKTANYKNVEAIVNANNQCPHCGALIHGLFDPEVVGRKAPLPCTECGWKFDKSIGNGSYESQLSKILASRSVKNVLLLTGTPILNAPNDLFPLLHLCDPVLFTTENAFLDTYCRKDHMTDKYEFRAHAMENLKPLIEGRFLARTYDDAGVEIPKQHVRIIQIELDKYEYPKQWRMIQQITKEAQILLDSGAQMTIMHVMSLITRKRQANVWPGGITQKDEYGEVIFSAEEVDESVKLDRVVDNIMSKNKEGNRQVVFSQFKTGLAELERRLLAKGVSAVRLDGDTPTGLRKRIKTNFYRALGEVPEWSVVLANYKTGGTGLNLTGATVTHILDEEWNPGKRDQAYGRTARMGQTDETEVFVYRIARSVDTWMSNTIHRKEMMVNGFNEAFDVERDVDVSTFMQAVANGDVL